MRAIIVADGEVPSSEWLDELLAAHSPEPRLVIAADGGALKAKKLGLVPDVVVGDADSLRPRQLAALRRSGVEVIVYPAQKDESDTELAVREALKRGADNLVIVGAFGGRRVEHTVANLLLLALPELFGRDVVLVDGPSVVRLAGSLGGGRVDIDGTVGDYVSLLPLSGTVTGVTTDGLRYPLSRATLEQGRTRGLSNELADPHGSVSTADGRLAVIHTRRKRDAADA